MSRTALMSAVALAAIVAAAPSASAETYQTTSNNGRGQCGGQTSPVNKPMPMSSSQCRNQAGKWTGTTPAQWNAPQLGAHRVPDEANQDRAAIKANTNGVEPRPQAANQPRPTSGVSPGLVNKGDRDAVELEARIEAIKHRPNAFEPQAANQPRPTSGASPGLVNKGDKDKDKDAVELEARIEALKLQPNPLQPPPSRGAVKTPASAPQSGAKENLSMTAAVPVSGGTKPAGQDDKKAANLIGKMSAWLFGSSDTGGTAAKAAPRLMHLPGDEDTADSRPGSKSK